LNSNGKSLFSPLAPLNPQSAIRNPQLLQSLLSAAMQLTMLMAVFLPPSLVAMSIIRIMAVLHLPPAFRDSWFVVSLGLTLRYAALAVIVLAFADETEDRQLSELAAVDGASRWQSWLYVHLPRQWTLGAGAMLAIVLFAMTEVPVTMMLLPCEPNFAQWLVNQMHAVRDQDVIVACLVLMGAYALVAAAVIGVHRLMTISREGQK